MTRILSVLLTPTPPLWRYCIRAYAIAVVPVFAVAILAALVIVAFGASVPNHARPWSVSPRGFIDLVIAAPLIETFGLALLVRLARVVTTLNWLAALLAGLGFAAFHLANSAANALGIIPLAFVMACSYLAWRQYSFGHAYWSAALIHFLNNSVVFGLAVATHVA